LRQTLLGSCGAYDPSDSARTISQLPQRLDSPPYSQERLLGELRQRRSVIERRGGDCDPREPLDALIEQVEAEEAIWRDAHPLGDGSAFLRRLPLAMLLTLPVVLLLLAASLEVNPNQWDVDWGRTVKLTFLVVYGGGLLLALVLPSLVRVGNWYETRGMRRE
jgi:hypothetical protein